MNSRYKANKTLLRKIKDSNKWRDVPCSWAERLMF